MRRPADHRAFTLLEMLVVVSIIALLVSLLLPSLKQARATAQRVQCATGVRQNSIAMRGYANDNRYLLPDFGPFVGVWPNWSSDVAWNITLKENMGPYFGASSYNPFGFVPGSSACPGKLIIYYYNPYVLGYDLFSQWIHPIAVDRIERSAEVYWSGDYLSGDDAHYGHHGYRNYSFIDGHAGTFKEENIYTDLLGGDFFNSKAHPY